MTHDQGRIVIAMTVIVAFTGMVAVVLFGVVDIASPEMAKLVGALVAYFTGLITPIVLRYFRDEGD